ncbi:hypothetical protein Tco_0928346 [Tanacetum coccineum]
MASDDSDQDAKYALSNLLQMGTVAEYESEFVVLANRVTGISESLLTSFYISGLKLALQIDLSRVSRWIKIQLQPIFFWEKGDPAPLPPWRAHTNHMRASKKELVILKSPLEQKSMFRRQEKMLRRQEQQRLAKDAKIQRRIWDPEIKSITRKHLEACGFEGVRMRNPLIIAQGLHDGLG